MIPVIFVVLAVILRIVSNPLGNVFQKQLTSRGKNPLQVNFVSYCVLAMICLVFAPQVHWPALPAQFWLYSVAGGMVGAAGNGFLVKAIEKGDLSVLGPVNAYKAVIGMIVGIFLLGELPTLWGLFGIALIILGSYFVLDTTEERFSWALLRRKEIQYRLLAMVLTAIEAVLIKRILLVSSPLIAFISWCWFGALFGFVLMKLYGLDLLSEARKINKGDLFLYLFLVLCIGIMQASTNVSLDHIPVGYALALFQLSIIISVFLGHRFFGEKDIRKKLIGSLIMMAGSVLIILLK